MPRQLDGAHRQRETDHSRVSLLNPERPHHHCGWVGAIRAAVLGAAVLSLVPALVPRAAAQAPSAPWRTTETAHFRIHYPEPYAAWALRLAGRLDAMRERLVREIGFEPEAIVDVVVMDPSAAANGYAVPVLGAPRMVLWTTPPGSDSPIGYFRDWGEMLALHEDAHLVQLLRPSRNPLRALIERTLLPVGPMAVQAPRWVIEGYATLVEGDLTGMGRPHGDMRAAILRRWAQQGRLPSYAELSGHPGRWLGTSMPYLAGSAYLEWLRARAGDDSLRDLWARMTARTPRTFDAAFRGVFGESPDALYGRFVAELARDALAIERVIDPVRHDGELWQRFEWGTGDPAISPDGSRMAVVLRAYERPARLVILRTGPDEEAERRRRERIERMLDADPLDVAPAIVAPPPREPLHVLPAIDGAEPWWPRWMPDGRSLLFVRFEPDAAGFRAPDLYQWHPDDHRVERLTRGAHLHDPDPGPDGRWAVAVRHRHGASQIVRIDLATGVTTDLTAAAPGVVYDGPRIDPEGRRLVMLRNEGQGWRAVVRDLESGDERELPVPERATLATPAWSGDGRTVYLSVGESGFIDIQAFAADGTSAPRTLTRTHGAALAPAPAAGGALYFLSLESHGLDVRLIDASLVAPPRPALPETATPVIPHVAPAPPEWSVRPVPPGRPSGLGRQEWLPLAGGAVSPGARALELGVRGGDLLGRLEYIGIASLAFGRRGPAGASAGIGWRGWPLTTLTAQLFWTREMPSRQPVAAPAAGTTFDLTRRGGEVAVSWLRQGRPTDLRAGAGVMLGRVEPLDGPHAWQTVASMNAGYATRRSRDRWHLGHGVSVRGNVARTAGESWQRLAAAAEAGAGHGRQLVMATVEYRALYGTPAPYDRLTVGGMPSSVLPPAVLAGRRLAPPLPVGALVGDEHRAVRVELRRAGMPFLHYERHQVRDRGGRWSGPVAWIGAELHVGGGPFPLLRLPGVEARVGVARLVDGAAERRLRWWAGARWFP